MQLHFNVGLYNLGPRQKRCTVILPRCSRSMCWHHVLGYFAFSCIKNTFIHPQSIVSSLFTLFFCSRSQHVYVINMFCPYLYLCTAVPFPMDTIKSKIQTEKRFQNSSILQVTNSNYPSKFCLFVLFVCLVCLSCLFVLFVYLLLFTFIY